MIFLLARQRSDEVLVVVYVLNVLSVFGAIKSFKINMMRSLL